SGPFFARSRRGLGGDGGASACTLAESCPALDQAPLSAPRSRAAATRTGSVLGAVTHEQLLPSTSKHKRPMPALARSAIQAAALFTSADTLSASTPSAVGIS